MEKTIIIILCLLAGCSGYQEIKVQREYNYKFKNDIVINELRDALVYTSAIFPTSDKGGDYWQTPEETYLRRQGDCEDFALLLGYLAWTNLQIDDVYIVCVKMPQGYHAITRINGHYYEPQIGCIFIFTPDRKIEWEAHYTEAIWMTLNYHDSVGKYY